VKKKHNAAKKKPAAAKQPAPAAPASGGAQPVKAAAQPAKPVVIPRREQIRRSDIVAMVLFSVLLFLAMTIQTGRMSLVLAGLAILLSIGRKPLQNFGARLSIPVIGLLAFALMNGLAAIYSVFDTSAISEFYKFIASFSLAVILLARFEKKHTRGLLWGFVTVCAVIALLCVDLSSWGVLFSGLEGFAELLGSTFADAEMIAAGTTRINGIYGDANLTGALLGMATLAGLYLVQTAKSTRDKFLSSLALGVSVASFFMTLSRGALLSFAVAALIYLAFAGKGNRVRLFFLMISTAIAALVGGGIGLFTAEKGSVLPVLMCLVAGVLLFLLDWGIGARLAARLEKRGALVALVCLVLVVIVAVGSVVALTATQPYEFASDGRLYRSVKLAPGEYTVTGSWDGDVSIAVYYDTVEGALMGDPAVLYSGRDTEVTFTVPEEAIRVFFRFTGEKGDRLNSVTLSNGSKVPLDYKFLPDSLTGRLHSGLFTSSSFLLRAQYMKDGMTLFKQSPVIGHGLGASEGLLTSVQPFYYETLYIHNHIIQVMDEMGVVGLICFLALLLGSLWLIIRRLLCKERDLLAGALLAVWVMMNLHSLMEINFSVRMFQCSAFFMLLLPVLLYAKPLPKKVVKWGGWILSVCVWAYLAVFGWLLLNHRWVQEAAAEMQASSAEEFMNNLRTYAERDILDPTPHQLNFVGNAVILGDPQYRETMEQYVEELRATGTYTNCSGLVRYYYLPLKQYDEMFACSREAIAQKASNADAWNLQVEFYRKEVLNAVKAEDLDELLEGVTELREYLNEHNEGRAGQITLTAENRTLLSGVKRILDKGWSMGASYEYLVERLAGE